MKLPMQRVLNMPSSVIIADADGTYIAEVWQRPKYDAKEVGDLIVTAVNNHQRLVGLVRGAEELFSSPEKYPDPTAIEAGLKLWVVSARAVLAEIEKEENK